MRSCDLMVPIVLAMVSRSTSSCSLLATHTLPRLEKTQANSAKLMIMRIATLCTAVRLPFDLRRGLLFLHTPEMQNLYCVSSVSYRLFSALSLSSGSYAANWNNLA
uniref:Uncharacterized protein n=1 Tax=Anopheles braziliensis TaxID=58242 RepID=A0A2M3ZLS1_9DIPT